MAYRRTSALLVAALLGIGLSACQNTATRDTGARGRAGDESSDSWSQQQRGAQGRQGTDMGGGTYQPQDLQGSPSPSGNPGTYDSGSSGARGRAGTPDDQLPGSRGSTTTNPESQDRVPDRMPDGGRY